MIDSDPPRSAAPGQRGRFRAARPPAPAPARKSAAVREATAPPTEDHSRLERSPLPRSGGARGSAPELASQRRNSTDGDEQVVRAGGSMAIATLISRITGFLRTVLIGSALGPAVASAFNTANTLPNLITELVLGAVLTSLVVPVLVRAEKEDPDQGAAFIRRLLTLTFTLTLSVTVLAVAAAPWLASMSLGEHGEVNVHMSTAFAFLVLPQILFYALFAVFMAVLNTKGIFKPGAWAPVINNVVTLAVLSLYFLLPPDLKLHPTDNVTITDASVLLLGLGTTAGVVMQALIMVPYLRKAGIDVRPLWGIDERLKAFGGMAIAIVVYVAISQLGWVLNNRIASMSSAAAPTIYTQAWQLLQVPYGVIGVTLLTAVMPRLSRNAADGDDKAVVKDLTTATKLTLLALIPIIVFFTAFGTLICSALFFYGDYPLDAANVLGWTVSFSAFTLIPYAIVLLHLRVFYAREEVWTPTFIIAGITITKLALAFTAPLVATEPRLVVVLLGAANGFGFLAGAIIGARLLGRSLGSLNSRAVLKTSGWAVGASVIAALIVWRMDVALVRFGHIPQTNPWFVGRTALAGIVFLGITGLILSRSHLPEVTTVGASLSRLPVLGKFITVDREAAASPTTSGSQPMLAGPATAQEAAHEAAVANSLLPALPPLSAGRVSGPRLVPGAPIIGGQYRLLADHGGSPAARLWQARDTKTGDVVALTIMDPAAAIREKASSSGNGLTDLSRRVAQARAQMIQRTRALAECAGPGLTPIREVVDTVVGGPNLVIVVADWVAGSPLTAVAESGPDPLAAGYAVADLADAVARTGERGCVLGLDHRDRIRISTQGVATLAFPGVLPSNTAAQDNRGIVVALELLLEKVPYSEVPEELTALYRRAKSGADRSRAKGAKAGGSPSLSPAEVARRLRALTAGDLQVDRDATPDPTNRAGFGAARNRPRSLASAGLVAFLSVMLVAAVIAAAISFFGAGRQDSPLSPNSLRQGATGGASQVRLAPLANAQEWMPTNGPGTPDDPQGAAAIADGNPQTSWVSDQYNNQLGAGPASLKPGIGLMVDLPRGTQVAGVQLSGLAPGTQLELRRSDAQTQSVDQAPVLATVDATDATMTVRFDQGTPTVVAGPQELVPGQGSRGSGSPSASAGVTPTGSDEGGASGPTESAETAPGQVASTNGGTQRLDRLLIWITKLPMPKPARLAEVAVAGQFDGGTDGVTTPPNPTPASTAPSQEQRR
ncbi:murein biosynthesis integral membrane protein MurJ [Corynebacterium heidelbergense]|nr:murein biosynthesis integral membrane protein MurJ [Corynebacterium heidelbergense]